MAKPDGKKYTTVSLILLGATKRLELSDLGLYPHNSRQTFTREIRHKRECGGVIGERTRCGDHAFELKSVIDESVVRLADIESARAARRAEEEAANARADEILRQAREQIDTEHSEAIEAMDTAMARAKAEAEAEKSKVDQSPIEDVPRKSICGVCESDPAEEPVRDRFCPKCNVFVDTPGVVTYLNSEKRPVYLTDEQVAELERLSFSRGLYVLGQLPSGYRLPEEFVGAFKQVGPADANVDYTILFESLERTGRPLLVIRVTKDEHKSRDFRFERMGVLRISSSGESIIMVDINSEHDVLLSTFMQDRGDLTEIVDAAASAMDLTNSNGTVVTETPARAHLLNLIEGTKFEVHRFERPEGWRGQQIDAAIDQVHTTRLAYYRKLHDDRRAAEQGEVAAEPSAPATGGDHAA